MDHCCIVYNCSSTGFNDASLKFFNLPSNSSRRYAWLKIIGRPELVSLSNEILSQLKVCSSHYKDIVFTEMVGARFYYEMDHSPLETKTDFGTEKTMYEDNALALALPARVQSTIITEVTGDDAEQLTTYLPSMTGNTSGIRVNNMFTATRTFAFLDTNFINKSVNTDLMLKRLYECIDPQKFPSSDFKTSSGKANIMREIEGFSESCDHQIPTLFSLDEAEEKENFTEKAEFPMFVPTHNTVAEMQPNSSTESKCHSTSNLKEENGKQMDSFKAVFSVLSFATVPEEEETENSFFPKAQDGLCIEENPQTVLSMEISDESPDKHNDLTGIFQSDHILEVEHEVKMGNVPEFAAALRNSQPNEREEKDPFLLSSFSPSYSPVLSDQENGNISSDSAISLFPPTSFKREDEVTEENPANELGIFILTQDLNLMNLKQKEMNQNGYVNKTSPIEPFPEIKSVQEEKNSPEESEGFISSPILAKRATKLGESSPVRSTLIIQTTEKTENVSIKSNILASSPVRNVNVRTTRMTPKEPKSSNMSPTSRTPGTSRKMKMSPGVCKSSPRSPGTSNSKKTCNKSGSSKTSPGIKTPSAPQRRRPKMRKGSLGVRMFGWNSNFTRKVNKFQYKLEAYSSPDGKESADCLGVRRIDEQVSPNSAKHAPENTTTEENEEYKDGPISPHYETPRRISQIKRRSDLPKKRSAPNQQDRASKRIKLDNSNPGNEELNQNPHCKNVLSSEQNEKMYASRLFASILQNIKREHRTECIIEVLKILRQYESK